MVKKATTSQTNIQPLHNFVLIRPVKAEEKTAGGILLPDTVKEKPQIGEVMAVGEGAWNEDGDERVQMSVSVGQKVMYKKWGGNEVKVENEELTLVEDKDILAIING